MNANEISPTVNTRLKRIKIVSRIVRFTILGILICFIFYLLLFSGSKYFRTNFSPWEAVFFLTKILLCVWYWMLAKLFRCYECGLIFDSKTIRCIKTLGMLCVINWLLATIQHFFLVRPPVVPRILPPGVTVSAPIEVFQASFFSIRIYGFDLGLLLAGTIIVIIAWIMDEGRKIQEEQELTV